MRRRHVKLLGAAAILLEVVLIVALVTSVFTLSSALTDSLRPSEGQEGPLGREERTEPSGGKIITYTLFGRNKGVLDAEVTLKLKLLSQEGDLIAEGADSKSIPAGSAAQLTVTFTIPFEDVQRYSLQTKEPKTLMTFECRTLFGLAGMGVTAEVD